MITAQYAHLRPAAGAGRLHGFARLVEDAHIGQRSAGAAVGTLDVCTLRPNAREVIAHAPTAPHGFGGLVQCGINTDLTALVGDAVADRLYKAVDQGGLQLGAGRGIDATAEDQSTHLRAIEGFLPYPALLRLSLIHISEPTKTRH